VGLEYCIVGSDLQVYDCPVGSCCELVLAGEPAEDWLAADLVVDEVDHLWGMGLGLDRRELPEVAVWPCGVEMVQLGGEDSA
jgi:hypothetical protein